MIKRLREESLIYIAIMIKVSRVLASFPPLDLVNLWYLSKTQKQRKRELEQKIIPKPLRYLYKTRNKMQTRSTMLLVNSPTVLKLETLFSPKNNVEMRSNKCLNKIKLKIWAELRAYTTSSNPKDKMDPSKCQSLRIYSYSKQSRWCTLEARTRKREQEA